jgi:hypothetical protein
MALNQYRFPFVYCYLVLEVTMTRNLDLEYQAWNLTALKEMRPQSLALNESQIADVRVED